MIPARTMLICWLIHIFTASGTVVALLTLEAGLRGDYPRAFLLMILAVLIDAMDGPLARRFNVSLVLPQIDGRKLDDITDYANYSFVPLVLLAYSGWLPDPGWFWAGIAMVASLFTFAHQGAKEDDAGFFRGFPSYWNVVVFYIGVKFHEYGPGAMLFMILGLSVLSVSPVWFVYPNKAPRWRTLFVMGGCVWMVTLLGLLWQYPHPQNWLLVTSFVYPVFYVGASWYLVAQRRRKR